MVRDRLLPTAAPPQRPARGRRRTCARILLARCWPAFFTVPRLRALLLHACTDADGVKKGKICDMIKEWSSKTEHPFISFEYFPPKTPEGVEKLHPASST